MLLRKALLLLVLGLPVLAAAQGRERQVIQPLRQRYLELGAGAGISHYAGDLAYTEQQAFGASQLAHLRTPRWAVQGYVGYHFHPHMWVRAQFAYIRVAGYDNASDADYALARNLSFEADIFELNAQVVYDFVGTNAVANARPAFTPYVFVGLGLMNYTPFTYIDQVARTGKVELQPLRTEDQETPYALTQVVIPMGFGFRFKLGDAWNLHIESSVRKTFTDYLDDVSGDTPGAGYPLCPCIPRGQISYRSEQGIPLTTRRGNPTTDDWYGMTTVGVSYIIKLGVPCAQPNRNVTGNFRPRRRGR